MKRRFFTEAAYAFGIVALALGTALMERADYGMSMVVAPAYLVHLKVSQYLGWFSFGMAEYCLQALLIIVLALVMHHFSRRYLFSFITAFIYGTVLDLMIALVAMVPGEGIAARTAFYLVGMLVCATGVSLLFKTYISPEAYELFVKELSSKYGWNINRTKTVYDCCSCLVAIVMSFIFIGFGRFEGVKLGTVFCALLNGWLIGRCTSWFDRRFDFVDGLGFRKVFE